MQAGGALASGIDWTTFMIPATIILAAGSMFILWLGERITDKGVGNGISLIIMIGIIARLPQALIQEFSNRVSAAIGGGIVMAYHRDYCPLCCCMCGFTPCTRYSKDSCAVC